MVDVRLSRAAAEKLLMHARLVTEPRWTPLPHQVPPEPGFYGWLLMAGRGAGKTDACARYVHEHVMGPPCLPGPVPHWIGIVAPTHGDAATSCFGGPSGLRVHSPDAVMRTVQGGTVIRWPNGSEAKIFGAHSPEDVERLRSGGNRCLTWMEELAAWRYLDDTWDQIRFGLRTGPRPHWIASTTPKPRALIKKLSSGGVANVQITRATTYDNPHLPEDIREALEDAYGGTQIGRQELYAEVIDQDENALWNRAVLDAGRLRPDQVPPLMRKSVGVDPSGGRGEQGIVVVGKALVPREPDSPDAPLRERTPLAHGYVLADRTCHLSPDGWGRRAVQAAVDFEADDICVETNFGGDMALNTIRAAADAMGIHIPIKKVTATRGKKVRAEPVSALTEQGRWHLAGTFPELEDQLCVVAGTLVSTQRGRVPIEQLRPDDMAWTRGGLAPIKWAGQTGWAQRLVSIHVQDCALQLTPWHKIYDPQRDRFVPAMNVRAGQLLAVEPNKESSVPPWPGADAGGTWSPTATTGTVAANSFTEQYGEPTTGPYRTATSCTTETGTSGTTRSGTWNSRHPLITSPNTAGFGAPLPRTALLAASSAGRNGPGGSRETGLAASAAGLSSPRPPHLATADRVAVIERGTSVPVYDLTIADGWPPEFYANGILVHNCTWYDELDWSPDRLDAMVWPAWHLRIVKAAMAGAATSGGLVAATRTIG